MASEENYLEINRQAWNAKTEVHVNSDFYDMEGFLKGNSSLKNIELDILGDIKGKSILHLQCHFGQDTLSLARMGASKVTGVDLSDSAIKKASALASDLNLNASFLCCDLYDLPQHLNEQFDIVFTTYGTIGWLPDLDKWANLVYQFLKPGGQFVFVEFHPFVWMFDNTFDQIIYSYFKNEAIIETENGTYADKEAPLTLSTVSWNHGISEVCNNLLKHHLAIELLNEYNYSPYNVFHDMEEYEPGKFRIKKFGDHLPLVYAIRAKKEDHLLLP